MKSQTSVLALVLAMAFLQGPGKGAEPAFREPQAAAAPLTEQDTRNLRLLNVDVQTVSPKKEGGKTPSWLPCFPDCRSTRLMHTSASPS